MDITGDSHEFQKTRQLNKKHQCNVESVAFEYQVSILIIKPAFVVAFANLNHTDNVNGKVDSIYDETYDSNTFAL